MHELKDNQYFFILIDIELFPEIKPTTIQMIEQLINAYMLINEHNIQLNINHVLELEYYCKPLLNTDYLTILNKIQSMTHQQNIHIVQDEQVQGLYLKYCKNKYYQDIGKQATINLEFELEKKSATMA